MKIAIIDKKDINIKLENESIKIDRQNIPFKLVDMLILNHKVNLNTSDILKLTKNKISILLLSHDNKNTSLIASSNSKAGELKLSQYKALEKRLKLAKYFLTNKIKTHIEHLKYFSKDINHQNIFYDIDNAQDIDTLLGLEGSFAKAYFKEYFLLFSKEFQTTTRTKHPPLDPLNSLLSYLYSLFYNIITVKLLSYGFEPTIGYLHTPFRTHNALSSDLLELFRAEINHTVYNILQNNILQKSDFAKKGGVYLKWSGRVKIHKEFIKLNQVLKSKLDVEIATLKRMINEVS